MTCAEARDTSGKPCPSIITCWSVVLDQLGTEATMQFLDFTEQIIQVGIFTMENYTKFLHLLLLTNAG
ncbi:hypothetical protein EJB05_26192 [Eragrostis curvula]|uniref:Uncharacterized protein n=1 Tax=Eragrostis curvula TaxID=38414 RepID=A0A5J9UKX3_9POAL|nr:hypothetical protein EJB05_26192 [Eragrostis curvula]